MHGNYALHFPVCLFSCWAHARLTTGPSALAALYAVGLWWQTVPFTLIECVVFSLIVYFMVGFTASASAFFTFLLIVLTVVTAFSSWIRLLACISPSQVVASSVRCRLPPARHLSARRPPWHVIRPDHRVAAV